jgi:uncharacterized protein
LPILIYFLVLLIAFLYASVGFGGATGYLAAMSLFDIPPQVMASTALTLNILVAGISFSFFYRAGHLRSELLLPFLFTSIPAAFVGGYFRVPDQIYSILLYAVLAFVGLRLTFEKHKKSDDAQSLRLVPPYAAMAIGLGVGFLSGVVGIGGGIFLSPIILLARWGTSKQAAAVAAVFIVLNSLSAVIGRVAGGTFMLDVFSLSLIPVGLVGALLGSTWGVRRLSIPALRRMLGVVMIFVVIIFWWNLFR